MSGTNRTLEGKAPYVRPAVKRVRMRPEEAVLAGCKTSSSGGYKVPQCQDPRGACQKMKS